MKVSPTHLKPGNFVHQTTAESERAQPSSSWAVVFTPVKWLSCGLITLALGLILWQLYAMANQASLPSVLVPILWIVKLAVLAHGIEGLAAVVVAYRQGDNAIAAGIYTFFTGTIGLYETLQGMTRTLKIRPNIDDME